MPFHSILFDRPSPGAGAEEAPDCLSDLNLDQVVAAVVLGREEYGLEAFFRAPQRELGTVEYRQEIMRDLTPEGAREAVKEFSAAMQAVRRHLAAAERAGVKVQAGRWFLDAAAVYCDAVVSLRERLEQMKPESRGLGAFLEHLREYTSGTAFGSLHADTRTQRQALEDVQYNLHINAGVVTVSRYGGESDYSAEVEKAFAKFRRDAARDYRSSPRPRSSLDLVEARLLEIVVRLFPKVFTGLEGFCERHRAFLDESLERFDREVQFYVAFLDFIEPLQKAGVAFCYPQVSAASKEEAVGDGVDLALAVKLHREGGRPVGNSFRLEGPERALVVTGPNGGGKTTFARMFGQLHYLAGLGCPVPAGEARLFLPDRVLTHFAKQERAADQRSELEGELLQARRVLEQATERSVVVMNEGFASSTLHDARLIGTQVLEALLRRGVLCVYVTFVDELASLSEATVSMVGQVDPGDPARRTFRIAREPASGLAHAAAIADQFGLGYERLRERLAR